jgi:circadian clock protein KaiB
MAIGVKRSVRKPKRDKEAPVYVLNLYITGQTPRSTASIRNLARFCEENLDGKFELKVIDIYQQPRLAKEAQIIAAPTLVKTTPPPLRRLVGDLSNETRVRAGLDIEVTCGQRGRKTHVRGKT